MAITVRTLDALHPPSADLEFVVSGCCADLPPRERRAGSDIEANVRRVIEDARERGDTFLLDVRDDGHEAGLLLVNEWRNPWTQLDEAFAYLVWLAPEALAAGAPAALIERLEVHGRASGWRIVRMEVPEAYAGSRWFAGLHQTGWSTSGVLPCADVAEQVQRSCAPPAGVLIRPATAADHGFAIDCLLESIRLGLSDYELSCVDEAIVRDNVWREFGSALEEARAFSYVAEHEGRLVAHATAEWSDNGVLGTREALLHDILVRDGLDGRGVGSALELEVVRECHRRGVPLLRGTLSFEHVSEERLAAVSARIRERGWWFSSRMLYKPLGVVDRADPVDPSGQQRDDRRSPDQTADDDHD